jgi:MoaA/NifB/PqqE/SkfB family radical SAM enzyme
MKNAQIYINRIEFVITKTCSGKCRHCSVAETEHTNGSVDVDAAVKVIKQLTGRYTVESIMTFGGEPLLYADTVCEVHSTARDCGIPVRQIITNGFFTRDQSKIERTAAALCASGANNILISVDAFHQEYIPIEPVIRFAESLVKHGIPKLRVHPAWLVNEQHQNPYNDETKRLLKIFNDMGIETSNGNDIFPAGNAVKYLSNYFPRLEAVDLSISCGQMPYTDRLDEISSVSINPNGDMITCYAIGNVYENDILTILDDYDPYNHPAKRAILEGGVKQLLEYAERLGIKVDINDCYSACEVCRKAMRALKDGGCI